MIIRSYLLVLLSIGFGSILVFIFGLYLIYKRASRKQTQIQSKSLVAISDKTEKNSKSSSLTISSNDINAIAGDDTLSTQLDLARAYIETGRKQLAKKILLYVAKQGNDIQQKEAKELLNFV